MKTPSILILLTIFVTYAVGFDYWGPKTSVQNQAAKLDVEALFEEDASAASASASKEVNLNPASDWPDPVILNMFQFITNQGCYFYEHGPWFPYLNDFISAELSLQLNNWCAKLTNIVY